MLRRRSSSFLVIRAFSQVSSSPLLFHSSNNGSNLQNPLGSSSAGPRVYNSGPNPDGFCAKGLDFDKRSDFDRVSQWNSSGFYGGNRDGQQERSDFGGVGQWKSNECSSENPNGPQRSNFGEIQQLNSTGFNVQNPNGHQRSNLGEIHRSNLSNFGDADQWNSNGFSAGNPNGPQRNNNGEIPQLNSNGFNVQNPNAHQRSNLGEIHQLNSSNFGGVDHWNSNGFDAGNPNGPRRNNIGEIRQLNSNGFDAQKSNSYQRSNLGEIHRSNSSIFGGTQQLNPHGYFKEDGGIEANRHFQNSNTENQRNSSEFIQNPSQNASWNYKGSTDEFNLGNPYQKSTDVIQRPDYHRNPGEFPQNSNALYGYESYDKTGNGELRGFQQNPNGNFGVGQGNTNQYFYGHNRGSPLPAGQQNVSQFPSDVSSQVDNELTGDGNIFKGTLIELDECCQKGEAKEAVEVLDLLRKNGVAVDLPRYLAVLKACGETKSLDEARVLHDHIYQAIDEVGVVVNNKILDMYAKCGSMVDAYQMFEKMPQRNLTTWDTMINGLANNNLAEDAIDVFTQFKELGMQPDGDIFIAVFNACGVLGAVDEGMLHFESMKVDFGISPTMRHYVGIVEMLGRSGYLDEAVEFIEKMPFEASIDVWETLMNLCRVNGYQELGNRCAEIVEQLDSSRLTEQTKMGLLPVNTSDMKKERKNNSNSLDFKRRTHELRAGDRSHPENDRIYEQLRNLLPNMKEVGYTPNTRLVLHDIDPEARAEALMAHSEKLAAAYVLLTSPPRSPMRILKNLRFCTDCHEAMKIISKLTGRLIICRDAKRFHHFENGVCSCKDFY